ncbi:hypothetical protein CPB84DRAFT_1755011 [Gymnopilus junonius]|uniref:Uncharacterized protein n=1 Tax=Gymnopilus junonius TaxID=109634 RepID=A0A9P5N8Q3_GYMJU|nr:hypothetical protein CPB84DRAFT_1755011 [Gymnopilus junonius]
MTSRSMLQDYIQNLEALIYVSPYSIDLKAFISRFFDTLVPSLNNNSPVDLWPIWSLKVDISGYGWWCGIDKKDQGKRTRDSGIMLHIVGNSERTKSRMASKGREMCPHLATDSDGKGHVMPPKGLPSQCGLTGSLRTAGGDDGMDLPWRNIYQVPRVVYPRFLAGGP